MRKYKKWLWLILIILLFSTVVLISAFIPRETRPSAGTRIILEHTYKTYIAPVCFEESDPTNFLEEATLQEAENLNYPPHSPCTEKALESENDRLLTSLLKQIGIMDKKWDNW
ncbi:hypothetical protein JSQ81_14105 [Sporosarcina sp. Marseille-Q4063]|uniref:hypothetical protein n=1 Tax=Sporosarcina sp. Marseille-Q4063 TaxID=2810514 RepID=UPI001BAFE584|nr:hypothetical protein [Sporosarcina sp. Marseille-Q4063]QUW20942.1 hypothetical protein JSQ81_14105 [Sporosarcina sp. Marseille-Q4063]